MRLFVALVPPAPLVTALAARVDAARREAPTLGWVAPSRWHLTLAFLGETDGEAPARLAPGLAAAAAETPPLDLVVGPARPLGSRVLVLPVDGDGLAPLARRVRRAARAARVPEPERRRFVGHLTLGRVRPGRPVDLPAVAAAVPSDPLPPWRADRVLLVRSTLGPAPAYDELAGWPMGG